MGLVVVLLAPKFIVLPGGSDAYVQQLAIGAPPTADAFSPLTLLRPRVTRTCASWLGSDAPVGWVTRKDSCKPLLLLGTANGVTVAYDAASNAVLRIPAAKVMLLSPRGSSR